MDSEIKQGGDVHGEEDRPDDDIVSQEIWYSFPAEFRCGIWSMDEARTSDAETEPNDQVASRSTGQR